MKKVLVIGSPGSGKSVFSRKLGDATHLPVIHLDRHSWRPGWVEPAKDVWDDELLALLRRESWIIDGNYSRTMDLRLAYCDTAIFLDFPRHICAWRVIKRSLKYRGRNRPDLSEGCPEQINLEFLMWTWTYPKRSRVNVIKRLAKVAEKISVVRLTTKREVEGFLASIGLQKNENGDSRLRDQHRQRPA